jgi:hypothetical protein
MISRKIASPAQTPATSRPLSFGSWPYSDRSTCVFSSISATTAAQPATRTVRARAVLAPGPYRRAISHGTTESRPTVTPTSILLIPAYGLPGGPDQPLQASSPATAPSTSPYPALRPNPASRRQAQPAMRTG